jgi:hypothetical protein
LTSTAASTERARSPRRDSGLRQPTTSPPADQAALGDAADARGLYRDAAQLHKNAAAAGNLRAASYLSGRPSCLRDDDARPVRWAVAHAVLDDPSAVAELLRKLRPTDAQDQVTAMLDRDPAACVSLDDPGGVARLLGSLREADARDQVTTLADRVAAHVPLATRSAWPGCWTACGR